MNPLKKTKSKLGRFRRAFELNRSFKKTETSRFCNYKKFRNSRACLFASWDPDGRIHDYVFEYLKELDAFGFDIYFCSTSEREINEQDYLKLKAICSYISFRQNVGLDFASWKLCYLKIPFFKSYKSILMTNDSVFGPIYPLGPLLKAAEGSSADVISMTDNFEHAHHLQSYFLYFKGEACSHFLPDFLNSLEILTDKNLIIQRYEIGLSALLVSKGYRIQALFPYKEILKKAKSYGDRIPYYEKIASEPVNPTILMWHILIQDFNFPFLKRELLTKNVAPSPNLDRWEEIVGDASESSRDSIKSYLSNLK